MMVWGMIPQAMEGRKMTPSEEAMYLLLQDLTETAAWSTGDAEVIKSALVDMAYERDVAIDEALAAAHENWPELL